MRDMPRALLFLYHSCNYIGRHFPRVFVNPEGITLSYAPVFNWQVEGAMWGSLSGGVLRALGFFGLRSVAMLGVGVSVVALGTSGAVAQEAQPEGLEGGAYVAPNYLYVPNVFQEEIPRGETVRTRQRPELDALGIHAGSFYLFPSLGNSISYDSNVFATNTGEKSDFVDVVSPRLALRSDWNNHSLNADAGGRLGFYFDETSQDYQDAFGRVGGHVDVSRDTLVRGSLGLERNHEEPSDPNYPAAAAEPTVFYTYSGQVLGQHRYNRVTVSGAGLLRYLDYDDVDATGGGTINNDDNDRTQFRPSVQVAYEFSPGYSGFIRAEGAFDWYDQQTADNGFEYDSQGYDVVGGASLDLTGLLFGNFFAGIRQRFYDDPRFDTITGPVIGSTLTWIPTGLTTVILQIQNQIVDNPELNSPGYTSTGVGLTVDHELLRNLILSAGGGFRYDDFEGITRTDKFYSGTVGAEYLMNRYLTFGAQYRYERRDSDLSSDEYSRNLVTLSVTAKY